MLEEYSFAFLHKHEFMGWGGKGLKDLSTMFWALAQIVMVTAGLILYFNYRKRVISKKQK
jgi:membrane protein CcdC involved in cytochrome C biogenesis